MRDSPRNGRPAEAAASLFGAAVMVPGFGHVALGLYYRGVAFFAITVTMFSLGLAMNGELFPLDTGEPLTTLAAVAQIGVGAPYFIAIALSLGAGDPGSVTYEHGYTFCIVAGLLNVLVALDAFDFAVGRKA